MATPTLRAAALEALGRTGDRAVLGILAEAFSDPARSTREAAIRALAELYRRLSPVEREVVALDVAARKDAFQSLTGALLEASLGTQRDAALLLGMIKRPEAARPLVLALGDPELRESAMQALAMIGAPAAETLAALAPDLESSLRADAYALLPRLGPAASDARVQALLAEALDDDSPEAAAAAATALGEVGDREALAPLLRALGGEEGMRARRRRCAGPARGAAITTKCACSCRAAGSVAPTRPICVACSEPVGAPRMRRSCGRRWARTSPPCAARRPRRWRSCRPASTWARR